MTDKDSITTNVSECEIRPYPNPDVMLKETKELLETLLSDPSLYYVPDNVKTEAKEDTPKGSSSDEFEASPLSKSLSPSFRKKRKKSILPEKKRKLSFDDYNSDTRSNPSSGYRDPKR